MGNDFAKQTLKHPNIKVLLVHPDGYDVTQHTFNLISRLSHNEIIVVVDQSIAFIGGIYLAFGRWDNHKHELTDNYPIHPCIKDKECSCDDEQQCDREGSCISAGSAKIIAIHFKLGTVAILGLIIHWRITWTGQKFLECHFMMLVVHLSIVQLKHFIQRHNAIIDCI